MGAGYVSYITTRALQRPITVMRAAEMLYTGHMIPESRASASLSISLTVTADGDATQLAVRFVRRPEIALYGGFGIELDAHGGMLPLPYSHIELKDCLHRACGSSSHS